MEIYRYLVKQESDEIVGEKVNHFDDERKTWIQRKIPHRGKHYVEERLAEIISGERNFEVGMRTFFRREI